MNSLVTRSIICLCVWARLRVPRIWGPPASLAVTVSGAFCVCGFCVACGRTLLDTPELNENLLRLCRCAAAFEPAVRNHSAGMNGACKFGGGGFIDVLRRRCLRRVLPCTVG